MMKYFTFNGVDSRTMGIRGIRSNRFVLPLRKNQTVIVPNSNQIVLIPDNTFNPITISVECLLEIRDGSNIFISTRNIGNWLNVQDFADLTFSDDPNYTYRAILNNEVVIEDLRDKRHATFTLEFLCQPIGVSN